MRTMMLAVVVLVAGCATTTTEQIVATRSKSLAEQGRPKGFVDGFADGCRSVSLCRADEGARWVRDDARAKEDAEYDKGWNGGNALCGIRCNVGGMLILLKK